MSLIFVLYATCHDLSGSSLCSSPWHGLEKLESTGQDSLTRLLVVKNSTTDLMLTLTIQVHVGTVVYTPFSENALSTLCNLCYSLVTVIVSRHVGIWCHNY